MALTKQNQVVKVVNLNLDLPNPPSKLKEQEFNDWWEKVKTVLQRQNEQIESAINSVYDTYQKTK